jgi:hypothetical protein
LYCYSTGHSYTDVEVDAIMNLGDIDGDGEIDLQVSNDDITRTLLLNFARTLSILVFLCDFIIRTVLEL